MKKVPGSNGRTRKENPPDIPFRYPPAKVPEYVQYALPINWLFVWRVYFWTYIFVETKFCGN